MSLIFSKSLIGDTFFSYLVHYLENERTALADAVKTICCD